MPDMIENNTPQQDRVMAKLVGGPYDGQFWSVAAELKKVTGIGNMPHQAAYVKDESTLHELNDLEQALADLSFADHHLTTMAEFKYED